MSRHAEECVELGIPYLYDPSMQAPRMTADELNAGFKGAKMLTGNDYEFGMMSEKLGITEDELRRRVSITVMTRGEAGALITVDGVEFDIPPAKPNEVKDPTGAGDAFRSGLITGYTLGMPWDVTGRIAALTAVYAIEHAGTQEHSYTIDEFKARYRENYGDSPELAKLTG
jgi:adenosine kinase